MVNFEDIVPHMVAEMSHWWRNVTEILGDDLDGMSCAFHFEIIFRARNMQINWPNSIVERELIMPFKHLQNMFGMSQW